MLTGRSVHSPWRRRLGDVSGVAPPSEPSASSAGDATRFICASSAVTTDRPRGERWCAGCRAPPPSLPLERPTASVHDGSKPRISNCWHSLTCIQVCGTTMWVRKMIVNRMLLPCSIHQCRCTPNGNERLRGRATGSEKTHLKPPRRSALGAVACQRRRPLQLLGWRPGVRLHCRRLQRQQQPRPASCG